MDILYLLVPLSVVLALAIGAAFWLAVGADQFEDLEGPGLAVVVDDDDPRGADATIENRDVGRLT